MNEREQNNQKNTEPSFKESSSIEKAEEAARAANEELHAAIQEDERGDDGTSKKGGLLRAIRTYREDVESIIATKKPSLFSLASAEEARRVKVKEPARRAPEKKHSSVPWIFLGISFVVLGIGAIVAMIFFATKESTPPDLSPVASLIASDTTTILDVTNQSRRELLNGLSLKREVADISLGEIMHVLLAEDAPSGRELVTAQKFLGMIEARVDDSFLRSLGEEYMLGVHAFDGNQPFLILKPRLFRNTFAGMLAWEPSLLFDLSPLFATRENPEDPSVFEDAVIRNIDVRAITKDGKYVLIYSFLDDSTLLITTNEHTFGEIISRRSTIRVF